MYSFVSTYICFLQVIGESLCLITDYLSTDEKIEMANSRAEATKAESLKLRKDLIRAMDLANEAKIKLKEVTSLVILPIRGTILLSPSFCAEACQCHLSFACHPFPL